MSNTDFDPNQPGGLIGQALGQLRPPRFDPEQGPQDAGGLWGQALRVLQPPNGSREPYIAASPRPATQWGKPDFVLEGARKFPGLSPGPFMPQGQDVQQLMRQVLGGLGKIGSPNIAALARMAGGLNSKWIKEFLQGREYAMKLLDQQHDRALEEIERRQQEESERYGIAMDYYKSDPVKLHEELRSIAQELNDTPMLQALDSGDATAPERLQQSRDRHWLSLSKFRAQNEKYTAAEEKRQRRDAILREYGEDPSAAPSIPSAPAATGPETPESAEPAEQPEAPAAAPSEGAEPATPGQDTDAPPFPGISTGQLQRPEGPQVAQAAPQRPPGAPGPPQAAGAPATAPGGPGAAPAANPEEAPPYQVAGPAMPPPTAPPANVPEGLTRAQASPGFTPPPPVSGTVNPNMRRIAHQILMGEKPALPRDKDAADFLAARGSQIAGQMQLQLDRIRDDPRYNKLTPGERQDATLADIRNVDPQLAQDVQNLIEGGRPPTGREAAKPGFQLIFSLARKADPSFDINTLNTRASTMRSFATGQDGRTLTSMATAGHHLDSLAGVADRLNQFSTQSDWVNAVTNMYAEHLGYGFGPTSPLGPDAGARIKNYDTVLHMVAPEIARAVKGAAPTLTEIKDIEGQLGANVPKEVLRQNVEHQRELIRARLDELKRRYETGVGNNPRIGLGKLFTASSSQPGFTERDFGQPPPGTLQPAIPPLPPGFNLADGLRQLNDRPAAPAPAGLPPGWSIR